MRLSSLLCWVLVLTGCYCDIPAAERDVGEPDGGILVFCASGDTCFSCAVLPCACPRVVCGYSPNACLWPESEAPCPPGSVVPDAGPPDVGHVMDCDDRGSECTSPGGADQACVPGGVFRQGDDAVPESAPAHDVFVSTFWMDRHEVTIARYRACFAAARCRPGERSEALDVLRDATDEELPMVHLGFEQMEEFCAWDGGRLPTEAEWERAARGDDGRTYPWGEETGCEYANWAGCAGDGAVPVGSYPLGASPFGLLDMIGNVNEVTSDEFVRGGRYDAYSPPLGVCDPSFPYEQTMFVWPTARGCASGLHVVGELASMRACTSAFREAGGPSPNSGFRCVRNGL